MGSEKLTKADLQRADALVTPHVLDLCFAVAGRRTGSIREAKAMLVEAVATAIVSARRSALAPEIKEANRGEG